MASNAPRAPPPVPPKPRPGPGGRPPLEHAQDRLGRTIEAMKRDGSHISTGVRLAVEYIRGGRPVPRELLSYVAQANLHIAQGGAQQQPAAPAPQPAPPPAQPAQPPAPQPAVPNATNP
ncbi:hypothetical protein AURDEDRAFT_164526 [Auricularia subglabra TFB-10046 SS5]|nr:hypothetical protein AURDEDRAFT_164526 [Auricularia subglabra TFB-10046 SS5]